MIQCINKFWIKIAAILALTLASFTLPPTLAAGMKNIDISNGNKQSTVTITFYGKPDYSFFALHSPERLIIDVKQSSVMQGLPLNFNGQNLVKRVGSSTLADAKSQRLVFELTQRVRTHSKTKGNVDQHTIVFTLDAVAPTPTRTFPSSSSVSSSSTARPLPSAKLTPRTSSGRWGNQVIVAIDAGHGGQDPGAIGPTGLHEKNVTIALARKLQAELHRDPMFKPVLTRDGDYFISVMGRSDVARKKGADVLVSIHADAAPNRNASGASVWVLSNRRANSELGNWLEQHEKQSELLGGAGDLLANNVSNPYLSQAVLDLQFGHSQRVGYDLSKKILQQLRRVETLHKNQPEHASLGVLRSPDIPSLLVETGFISNPNGERLLGSSTYQDKIAHAIYEGLRCYFLLHPLQTAPKVQN